MLIGMFGVSLQVRLRDVLHIKNLFGLFFS
jgi:hypothetical protein